MAQSRIRAEKRKSTSTRISNGLRIIALGVAVALPGAAFAEARIDTEAAQRLGATNKDSFTRLLQQKLADVRRACKPHLDVGAHRSYAVCFNEGDKRVTEELFLDDGPLATMKARIAEARIVQMERVDRGELTFDEATEALRVEIGRITAR